MPKTSSSLSSLSLASTNGVITEIKGDVLKFMAMQQRPEFCPNFENDDNLEHNPASTEVNSLPIQQFHGHFCTVQRELNKVSEATEKITQLTSS